MDGEALASPIGAAATAVAPTTPKGTVKVRLTRPARKAVAGGRRLRVVLSASFAGAEPRRLALRLGAGK